MSDRFQTTPAWLGSVPSPTYSSGEPRGPEGNGPRSFRPPYPSISKKMIRFPGSEMNIRDEL